MRVSRFAIVVGAAGFSDKVGRAAALTGQLPAEDPAGCFDEAAAATTVDITAQESASRP